jgi:hypothetical protein
VLRHAAALAFARRGACVALASRRGEVLEEAAAQCRAESAPHAIAVPTDVSNLTDPDSTLMRRSDAYEYRQAYNAQAVVCAEGSQLILATGVVASPSDAPSFAATIPASACRAPCLPASASPPDPPWLRSRRGGLSRWSPSAAPSPTGLTSARRPSRSGRAASPNPGASPCKPSWTPRCQSLYARRKQAVELAFGIINSAIGFAC